MIKYSDYWFKPEIYAIKLIRSLPLSVSSTANEPLSLSLSPSGTKSVSKRMRVELMCYYCPRMPPELWAFNVLFFFLKRVYLFI